MLIDSSAWIEFLRGTDSTICRRVDAALDSVIVTTDPIVMELTAGALHESELDNVGALLGRARMIRCVPDDYLAAAHIYRTARLGGETIRSMFDCLIAAVAIRADVPLLHADHDFDVIARHSSLRILS